MTATATDVPGLSTAQAFDVTVRPFVAPTGFDIQLGFTSSVSASARDVIRAAASTWESILANTELSDVTFNRRVSCGGVTTTGAVGTVDELLILVTAESIDGPRGSLGYGGPCTLRTNGGLPVVGGVVLDSEDMDRIPATTGLLDLAIHEMAHVLGFGILWDDFGLLRGPFVRHARGRHALHRRRLRSRPSMRPAARATRAPRYPSITRSPGRTATGAPRSSAARR